MQEALPLVLLVVGLLVGLLTGAGAAWLVWRTKALSAYERGKNDGEAEKATLVERLQGREQAVLEMRGRLDEAGRDRHSLQGEVTKLKQGVAQLETTLQQERKQAAEKLAVVNDAQQKLSDAFKALAAEALQSNNQSFLELAKTALETSHEAAKGDLEKRQQAIDQLVQPVKESLKKVDEKIQDLEVKREGAYRDLLAQVGGLLETQKQLRSETGNLVKALRTPAVRGRWGEIQLRRVVELAGMVAHCDFCEQQTMEGSNGKVRPDLVVRLPAQKNIVVDAKVPLTAFLESLEAADDETRQARLQAHAQSVRNHITALSRKSYFEPLDQTPEFVVLFIPGEVFFSAALEHDPELIEIGAQQKVIIATPTTLIALLRAVHYGWRQERLAQNAQEISDLGRELYKRVANLGEYLTKLGKSLKDATEAYNQAIGSLESRVLVTARKFEELHVAPSGEAIEPILRIDTTPRPLQSPEFTTKRVGLFPTSEGE
jgi:DNA recombination protein RmuC